MNIYTKLSNINYKMLNYEQAEKVKEEVVEGKTEEVKSNAPEAKVITGDADAILAAINMATVPGVSTANVVKSPKDNPPELEAYYNLKAEWNQNNANMTNVEKAGALSNLIEAISHCLHSNNAMPEGIEVFLRNELIYWQQLNNSVIGVSFPAGVPQYAVEYIEILSFGGEKPNQHWALRDAFELLKDAPAPACVDFFKNKVNALKRVISKLNVFIKSMSSNYPNATMPNNPDLLVLDALQDHLSVVQQQLEDARRFLEQAQLIPQQFGAQIYNGPADE